MTTRPFAEMRAMGVTDVLNYCADHRCSHYVETSADGWPDDVRLSDIEDRLVCSHYGDSALNGGHAALANGFPLQTASASQLNAVST
ncbi:MAG: hypothetical protein ABIL01_01620 [Pseudomonadota bacterium]